MADALVFIAMAGVVLALLWRAWPVIKAWLNTWRRK